MLDSGDGGRRRPSRSTWRAAALFSGVVLLGAVASAVGLSIARSRVTWTGGWPVMVFASAIATWVVALLAGVQIWDLAEVERHGADVRVESGNVRLLPWWLQAALPMVAPLFGFLIGWKFW